MRVDVCVFLCVCICANALLAPFHPVPGPNFKSYLARASALGCAVVHAVVCCKQPFTISLSDVSQSLVSVFIDKLAMRSYSSLQMDEMNVNGISLCMFVSDFSGCFVKTECDHQTRDVPIPVDCSRGSAKVLSGILKDGVKNPTV